MISHALTLLSNLSILLRTESFISMSWIHNESEKLQC